jgi:integrase
MKLTQRRVEDLECPAGKLTKKGKPIRNAIIFDGALAVRASAGAERGSLERKSFFVQYSYGGIKRRVPLGKCRDVSLADAQKAAKAVAGQVAQGRDPGRERQEKARAATLKRAHDALTLGKLVDQWKALHLTDKRPRYAAEAARAIRSVFEKYLNYPAAAIDRKAVVRVTDALKQVGSPIMAARAAAYARAAYEWAVKRGALDANPFHKLPVAPTVKRDRVLADEELRAVWAATEAPALGSPFNAIVRMLILTGQRREEVAGMAWGEISADGATWTIPASRAKNGAEHIVPLSAQAQALIAAQPRPGDNPRVKPGEKAPDLVFPGLRGTPFNGFSKAKDALDRSSGVTGWVLHDLRRTAATGLQKLGVRLEVTEAVLNHVSGSRGGIVGVYQRHTWADEKRAALAGWGARVEAIVEGRDVEGAGKVVALRA